MSVCVYACGICVYYDYDIFFTSECKEVFKLMMVIFIEGSLFYESNFFKKGFLSIYIYSLKRKICMLNLFYFGITKINNYFF